MHSISRLARRLVSGGDPPTLKVYARRGAVRFGLMIGGAMQLDGRNDRTRLHLGFDYWQKADTPIARHWPPC
jgi:hypothetical protein